MSHTGRVTTTLIATPDPEPQPRSLQYGWTFTDGLPATVNTTASSCSWAYWLVDSP